MTTKELTELALDGHNYPAWSSDMKISLSSRGLIQVLNEPEAGDPNITEKNEIWCSTIAKALYSP